MANSGGRLRAGSNLDETIGNATASLLGFGDVAAQRAGASMDVLTRATQIAGRSITRLQRSAARSSKPATTRWRQFQYGRGAAPPMGCADLESAREWGSADDHAGTQRRLVHGEATRGTVRHQRGGDHAIRQSDQRKQRDSRKMARERASGDREDAQGARGIEPGRRRLAEHAHDDRAGDGGGGDAVPRDGRLADGAGDEVQADDVSSAGARQGAQGTDRDARPQRSPRSGRSISSWPRWRRRSARRARA